MYFFSIRFRDAAILGLCLILLLPNFVPAQNTTPPTEYQLKSAFLFNFAKFVEWPTNAFARTDSPFVIGILGKDPFGKNLENTVLNKMIGDHPIVIKSGISDADAANCHIVFVSSSEKNRFAEILTKLASTSVLTIAETDGFIKHGGMVQFFMEAQKIRFYINDEAAKKVNLKISSKLLSLASPFAE